MARHIRRNIKQLIRPLQFKTVLDLGCGQGSFLQELRSEFPRIEVAGTDISPAAIALAAQKVPHGTFSVLDATHEHLDTKFDLIVCSEVLEHIPDDMAALRHIAAMTGKYLVISTIQGRMRPHEPAAWGHVRNYARGELVDKLQRSGFNVLRVVEWGFPFYSPLYRNAIGATNGAGTTGKYGLLQRLIAALIYRLFLLNSSSHGDEIFVLAERRSVDSEA